MNERLNVLTNFVVIGVALLIGGTFLKNYIALSSDSSSSFGPTVGDKISPPRGYSWINHPLTLVLALKDGCQYCERNMPFYRTIAKRVHYINHSTAQVIAVFPDSADTVARLKAKESLDFAIILTNVKLSSLRVTNTPTVFLVDSDGIVRRVWIGTLNAADQAAVLDSLQS